MSDNLFADFPYTTVQEWLAQIAKDLKGRSLAEMNWSPDGDLIVNPYVHADDVPIEMPEISSFGKWLIGESFVVNDALESNLQILEALTGGAESLHISCSDDVQWNVLLADVELPLIHIGLQIHGNAENALRALYKHADTKYKPGDFQVSIHLNNLPTQTDFGTGDFSSAKNAKRREKEFLLVEEFPFIRVGFSAVTSEQIVEGLCSTIYDTLVFADWNPERLSKCDLSVTVGMHYLIEIARLRALRILWTNLASSLSFSLSPSFAIEAHTTECAKDDDPYTHMIRSTVMGLATVLGGADRIYIQPSSGGNHTESFSRHIARNIHHLLRMESKFSEITDPIAGAYYLNKLTRDIVDKVWEMLMRRIKESGRETLVSS